jgi:integrase
MMTGSSWNSDHCDHYWCMRPLSARREHVRDVNQQANRAMRSRSFGKCQFLIDCRYGWALACEKAFGPGKHPVAIAHEWNTIAHLNDYEGNPEARPFTRAELQRFLDYADEQVERAAKSKRKGALAAYRDATLFKVIYGWGLFSRVCLVRWRLGFSRLCSSEAVG